jgi:hypothetical protein
VDAVLVANTQAIASDGRAHPAFSNLLGGVMRAIAMSLNPVAIFVLGQLRNMLVAVFVFALSRFYRCFGQVFIVALGSDDAAFCRSKTPRRGSEQPGLGA